jgi:hypothetical protein
VLYAAKCYWPGVSETDLEQVAIRAAGPRMRTSGDHVVYLGSLFFSADNLVLCLLDGPSRAAVKHASERLGIPCERLMDSVWIQAPRATVKGPES